MKKLIILSFFLLTGVFLSACSGSDDINKSKTKAEYRKIDAEQGRDMIDKDKSIILLDVRTQEEYREKRIDGSILIPDFELEEKADKLLPDKDKTIIVYCRSGRRSKASSELLIKLGYTNVYDMGGIIDWPYETISG